jgi:hypothetical protein
MNCEIAAGAAASSRHTRNEGNMTTMSPRISVQREKQVKVEDIRHYMLPNF